MAISKNKVKAATAAASYFTDTAEPAEDPQQQEQPARISDTAAGAQVQEPVKKNKGGKVLTTFFIEPSALEATQLLANFRSITTGKNISQGNIIREAVEVYLEDHRQELEDYRQIAAQIPKK